MQSPAIAHISTGTRAALILALALSLLGAGPAQARGYLLDPVTWYVATTGLDTNSCLAFDAPCATINGAIGKAAAGDTIKVAIGTYAGTGTEVVIIDRSITLLGGWDEAFAEQTGIATIDGEEARSGVYINAGTTVAIDHFAIKYGVTQGHGGGIFNGGVLTLTNSVVSNNTAQGQGGGIANGGDMTITDTTISNNTAGDECCSGGGGGAGIQSWSGNVILNNTTLSGNKMLGVFWGSAIYNIGTSFVLNNSTVSGNTGAQAIYSSHNNLTLNNSTVARNAAGVHNENGTMTVRNSILAENGGYDCHGSITSSGYNLIGRNTNCGYTANIGDKVGTEISPINPRLMPLADYGGPTFTHALMKGSPALNAGNPATPGSEARACRPTDQRGIARPVDSRCDMGAFEGRVAGVLSITRLDPNPTSASSVWFKVTFSEPVTGVGTAAPFDDFSLTKTGITGGSIASVSGSGSLYTVTVKTGLNNGTLRLNVVDNESIFAGPGNPLGGPGAGNGDYLIGPAYTIKKIPTPIAPATEAWNQMPTFKWSKIPGATQYHYQVFKGTMLVYSKTLAASICGAMTCQNTPAKLLPFGAYKWRIGAMTEGTWKAFSPYKAFSIIGTKAGYWKASGIDFYVTPSRTRVNKFSIYIGVRGCGNYKITHTDLVPIASGKFKFTGAFYANGVFSTPMNAAGLVGLNKYYIPGCGYVSGGPYNWNALWLDSSQPDPATDMPSLLPLDELDLPIIGPFTVEPLP